MSRDRDVLVRKHATPPKGIDTGHVTDPVFEDLTGQFSTNPDELKRRRRKRSTSERLEILEEKHDRLIHKVLDSRTKIITAAISAIAGLVGGYLLGGCF